MRLKFKLPCNDCPLRRESLQGWLGASSPEQFSATIQAEAHMPCHQTVDYDNPDWRSEELEDAAFCAGALIHIKNQLKSPRDSELARAVAAVEKDSEHVFQWSHEFIEHHNSGEFKSWKNDGPRISPGPSS